MIIYLINYIKFIFSCENKMVGLHLLFELEPTITNGVPFEPKSHLIGRWAPVNGTWDPPLLML